MSKGKHCVKNVDIGGKNISFETGIIAKQANGSVMVRCGDTVVFSSVCSNPSENFEQTFLSVRVDYQEKFSSVGKTVGGFLKREGRSSDKEILIARLIDRPLRTMFPKGFYNDVQVSSFVWSYDKENSPDVLAICASSAALMISSVPFKEAIAAVRVVITEDGQLLINPNKNLTNNAKLNCIIAGSKSKILMIEGHGNFASKNDLKSAMTKAQEAIYSICVCIDDLREESGKPKQELTHLIDENDSKLVEDFVDKDCISALDIEDKNDRERFIKDILANVYANESFSHIHRAMLNDVVHDRINLHLYTKIKDKQIRCDNRSIDQIREIDIQNSLLPRSHGSVLFTRGQTQALVVCTLGGDSMSQRFETLDGEGIQKFYLQYFFPGFSVGEIAKVGSPGRRELGHGKLAEKSLESIIPAHSSFPYSIRIESTITESNGSSSMASVCGGCLCLMNAGVPIKSMVAGIAMGMVGLGIGDPVILHDISGTEDAFGNLDFKFAGNQTGITGLQMDIKVDGVSKENICDLVDQSFIGIGKILSKMKDGSISKNKVCKHAPKIICMSIKPSKIPIIIGSSGRTIKNICEKTGAELNIDQTTNSVYISSTSEKSIEEARKMIEDLVCEISIGNIYEGKVKSTVAFGIFVEITPGKEGLCHVSELSKKVPHGQPIQIKPGERISVKVLDINEKGQIKLTQRF